MEWASQIKNDDDVFSYGHYRLMRRSMQLDAWGLLEHEAMISKYCELKTGLRFKPLMIEDAIRQTIDDSSRNLNTSFLPSKTFARACVGPTTVTLCHARVLPGKLGIAIAQLTKKEQQNDIKALVEKIAKFTGSKISMDPPKPAGRQLKPRQSEESAKSTGSGIEKHADKVAATTLPRTRSHQTAGDF